MAPAQKTTTKKPKTSASATPDETIIDAKLDGPFFRWMRLYGVVLGLCVTSVIAILAFGLSVYPHIDRLLDPNQEQPWKAELDQLLIQQNSLVSDIENMEARWQEMREAEMAVSRTERDALAAQLATLGSEVAAQTASISEMRTALDAQAQNVKPSADIPAKDPTDTPSKQQAIEQMPTDSQQTTPDQTGTSWLAPFEDFYDSAADTVSGFFSGLISVRPSSPDPSSAATTPSDKPTQ